MQAAKNKVENHLCENEFRWFAINTRYKAEKMVCQMLQKKGIEAYLPINRVVREYTRKRKVVEMPLINCYLFVKINRSQYNAVLETNNVIRFIRFSQDLISIPENEIELLRCICQEQENIQSEALQFHAGQAVEIIGGNLTGVKGILQAKSGRNFVVELNHIGIGLHMEIDRQLLRPIRSNKNLAVQHSNGLWEESGW